MTHTTEDQAQLPREEPTAERAILYRQAGVSVIANLLGTPFRFMLNNAATTPTPRHTLAKAWTDLAARPISGPLTNTGRGFFMLFSQLESKRRLEQYHGPFAGIVGSAFTGMVIAMAIETYMVRDGIRKQLRGVFFKVWHANPSLAALYFTREMGFSISVLGSGDRSPWANGLVFLASAGVTASAHKGIISNITHDSPLEQGTRPDVSRDGLRKTLHNLTRGNVYTHAAWKNAPFPGSSSPAARLANVLHLCCGTNIAFFRLLYLAAFSGLLNVADKTMTRIDNRFGLFKPAPMLLESEALNADSRLQEGSSHSAG